MSFWSSLSWCLAGLTFCVAATAATSGAADLLSRARAGDAVAQDQIAWLYRDGQGGLPPDPVQALAWYRKAADQGNADALASLGFMYESGTGGLPKNEVRAAELYRKAAAQGDAFAQAQLGYFYDDGRGGIRKDPVQAAALFRKAADQGDADAQNWIGVYYQHGRGGLARDNTKAMVWYRKAAAQGDRLAASNVYALEHPPAANAGNARSGGGNTFCPWGLPDGLGGCINNGRSVDPTTGKPLY